MDTQFFCLCLGAGGCKPWPLPTFSSQQNLERSPKHQLIPRGPGIKQVCRDPKTKITNPRGPLAWPKSFGDLFGSAGTSADFLDVKASRLQGSSVRGASPRVVTSKKSAQDPIRRSCEVYPQEALQEPLAFCDSNTQWLHNNRQQQRRYGTTKPPITSPVPRCL